MNKKKNLTDVFREKSKQEASAIESTSTSAPKTTQQDLPPSRQGKKRASGWFHPQVIRQLKHIAADEGKTQEQVMADAFNGHFREKGLPTIA